MERLLINNFGAIELAEFNTVKPLLFLVGESGSGKSTILKVLAIMRHIYKQLILRSYLRLGSVTEQLITLSFDQYLRNGGFERYVKDNTRIEYERNGVSFAYVHGKLQGTKNVAIPIERMSLEKLSFLSDKRGAIASLLSNNGEGRDMGFYFQETFSDFKEAASDIKALEIPFLHVRYEEAKLSNGIRKFFVKGLDSAYGVELDDASSGMQTVAPLTLIAEYFSKDFDIVRETNRAIIGLLGKSDSLSSFKQDANIGDIKQRNVHLFIEEPELSLFPKAQRSALNMLVRKRLNANVSMTLSVATHSPYIINHLNLLLKAYDKGVLVEGASVNYDDLGVYAIVGGKNIDLKVGNAHLVNTDCLSDDINNIYDEYENIDKLDNGKSA